MTAVWLPDGVEVEVIARLSAEDEYQFVAACQAIADAGRHGIRLRPDNLVTQDPAVARQREGEPFRREQQTLHPAPCEGWVA